MKYKIGIDFDFSGCYYEGEHPDLKFLGIVTQEPHPNKKFRDMGAMINVINGKPAIPDVILEIEIV